MQRPHLPRHLPELDSRRLVRAIIHTREKPPWLPHWKVAVCALAAGLIAYLPSYTGLEPAPRRMLFILVLAAGLWLTEAMPAFAVALLVIGLEILLLGREGGVFAEDADDWLRFVAPWASPLIWLFLAGFVLSAAATKTRLDRLLTERLLRAAGTRPRAVLGALMGATFLLSAFMSNTATTAMMFVVLTPIIASLDEDPFVGALCLGIPVAANLGGMATIIGSPPNAIAAGLLVDTQPIGFLEWILFGLPMALLAAVGAWWWLPRRFRSELTTIELPAPPAPPAGRAMRVLRWRQRLTGGTILLTILLWMTTGLHGMPVAVASFLPICVLTTAGVLEGKDIRSLPWEVLMLLAGGLALGVGVADTGLADWLVAAVPTGAIPLILLALVLAFGTVVVSNFMSNTAAANVVLPLAIAMAGSAPAKIAIPVALSASAAMALPISTPPNAIAYASGRLGSRDFLFVGVVMAIAMPPLVVLWTTVAANLLG